MRRSAQYTIAVLMASIAVGGCSSPWNDPYPANQAHRDIVYSAFTAQPRYLDPARAYSADEYVFLGEIYEPPFQYQYLERPYRLVPLTATTVPKPFYLDSAGHRIAAGTHAAYSVYIIHIRPGIRYQPDPCFARTPDGGYRYYPLPPGALKGRYRLSDFHHTGTRELNAADYVYEIKRLADPRLHSPIYGLMSEYIVGWKRFGKTLAGAYQNRPQGTFIDLRRYPLTGVKVLGRYTYSITIRGRYPQFRYWLAMPFFAPMPWEADRFFSQPGMAAHNLTLNWYPVGTGPYMLTANNPNREMVLKRNPNFHKETYPRQGGPGDAAQGLLRDAGKRLPFVNEAVFSLEKESIPYWNKFLQGYYDRSGIGAENFDQVVRIGPHGHPHLTPEMRRRHMSLSVQVQTAIYFYGFNMLDPVVGGYSRRARDLRRAISVAINIEHEISIFQNGRAVPAQGPIPPGIFGYRKGQAGVNPYVYRWVHGSPRRRSLSYARRLLAKAGYPDGRSTRTGRQLVLYFDAVATGATDQAMLAWMRKQFAKLNIDLVVRATDYNRFQDKVRRGNVQIFSWGWNADYPDPENFLSLLYGPNGKVASGGENVANYNDPAFNQLFLEVKDMGDTPKRARLIGRMVRIAQRDAPWVWGYYPEQYVLSQPWYFNAKPNLMANNTLKYVRIDPKLRARLRRRWNHPIVWPLAVLGLVLAVVFAPAVLEYRRRERRRPL
ncbi:MAG: ABC transporter substrate-binding protein [Acidiferrobacteraceae bacterium]